MRKKILSFLLTLCMVLTLMPTMAVRVQAEEPGTHTNHCICGASHNAIGDHRDGNKYEGGWTPTETLPDSAGYYYLTDDVTLGGNTPWSPADGTVLCLNGHTINASGLRSYCIIVEDGREFTLSDCGGRGQIIFDSTYGGGVMVESSATFDMYGGNITMYSGSERYWYAGVINAGTFNMYGGSITKCTKDDNGFNGGGVYNSGNFTMYGGQITNNKAKYGGGVYNSGNFTMSGGQITNNDVFSSGDGGGVYNTGTFTVSNTAYITGNTKDGGSANNVYLPDSKTITIGPPLEAGASIGVTVQTPPTGEGAVNIATELSSDYSSYFSSDNTSYKIEFEDNKLKMKIACSHSGMPVNGQAATCTQDGWKEYYHCTAGCNGYFKDENCTMPIPDLDTWKTGAGKIDKLGHSWTYSASGDTITATCNNNCGQSGTMKIEIGSGTTYTGNALTPASVVESFDSSTTSEGIPTPFIKYFKTDTKGAVSGGTQVVPITDAGYYYASITVSDKTAVKAFEIKKADSTISNTPVPASLTYNEAEQELLYLAPTTSDGTVKYAVTTVQEVPADIDFSTDTPKATNAGTYYVYYKVVGDGNHNAKIFDPITVTIAKKAQTVSAPTASETKATKVTLNEATGIGAITYAKSTTNTAPEDSSQWQSSTVFTALSPSTTYYFFARCAGDSNNLAGTSTGTAITTSAITEKTITGIEAKTGINDPGIPYGTAITPDKIFTGTPALTDATDPETAYRYEGVAPTDYSESTTAPKNVGTYKLVIVMNDDDFYGEKEIEFKIVKSTPPAFNATGVAPTGSGVSDGKIKVTGVETALYTLQYKGDGESPSPAEWTDIVGLEVTGLAAGGKYLVRIKPTNNNDASPEKQVTIPAYTAPPAGGGGGASGGGSSAGGTTSGESSTGGGASGGESSTGGTNSEVTTSTDSTSNTTTTTAQTEVKVENGTASATVKAENVTEAIKQASEKKSTEIVFTVSEAKSGKADTIQLTISKTDAQNIIDKTAAELVVDTPAGDVILSQTTLGNVIKAAEGTSLTVEVTKVTKPTEVQKKAAGDNGYIVGVKVESHNKSITSFGGETLSIRLEIPTALINKDVAAIHIADDGKTEKMPGKVVTEGKKKYYEFTTTHLSTFALIDNTQTVSYPKKGTILTGGKTKSVYKITKAGTTGGTVQFAGTKNKTAKTINIPATVTFGGIKYKVTSIAEGALKNNKVVTEVVIGKNVTVIGKGAFSGCKKLKSVTIGKGVKTINVKAFYNCTELTKLTIPAGVSKISDYAFKGCSKLSTLEINSTKLTTKTLSDLSMKGISTKAKIKVPKAKLETYKKLFAKKGLSKKVTINSI